MRKPSVINSVAAAVATTLLAATGSATTQSNYSGASCKAVSGSVAFPDGSVVNTSSTTNAVVECPVTKRANASIASGRVIVRNRNPTANVQCTLYSRFAPFPGGTGFEFYFDAGNMLPIFQGDTGFVPLYYLAVGSTPDDYYHFRCTIPPAYSVPNLLSQIATYQVVETF